MKKKFVMILSLVLAVSFMLSGCAKGGALDGTQIVATMDESVEVTLGEVNLMLRYEQAEMDTYYGSMFGTSIYMQDMGDGTVYGEVALDTLLENYERMHVLEAEAANYGVELTEDEKAAITSAAKQFMADNSKKTTDALGVTQAQVERVLTLVTIEDKMYDVITADADTEVSDEEAAQTTISYVFSSKLEQDEAGNSVEKDDAEKAEAVAELEALLAEAKETGDFNAAAEAKNKTASQVSFGKDNMVIAAALAEAVEGLKDGEYTAVVETEEGYYAACVDKAFDEEATASRKDVIVQGRRDELFNAEYATLAEAHTYVVNEEVAAQLTFDRLYMVVTE